MTNQGDDTQVLRWKMLHGQWLRVESRHPGG